MQYHADVVRGQANALRYVEERNLSIPFAHRLGRKLSIALLYPGEAGRQKAGPSPVCGLTALFCLLQRCAEGVVPSDKSLCVRMVPKTRSGV